jgi:hypothetical protein
MKNVIITGSEFDDLREASILKNPAVKLINLNDIELDINSIVTNTIKYQGTPVRIGNDFIKDLAKILNVNVKLQKNLTNDDEVGQDMFAAILNGLKAFSSRKRIPQVTLIGDVASGIFTNVVSGQYARISNEGLFDIATELIETHNGLQLIEAKMNSHSPDLTLKLLAPNEHRLAGNDDEVFNFGLTLSNNAINTFLGDFAYRLICTNGMMGMKSENNFKLSSIDTGGLLDMQNHLNEVAKRNFMPADFEANINTAQEIEASFYEVEQAFDFVKRELNILDDHKDRVEASIGFRFFKPYFDTINKMKLKGFDFNNIDKKQKQFTPSGMKMWELINVMTYLGSNNIGVDFKDTDRLQVYGGKLMSKDADLKYAKFLNL